MDYNYQWTYQGQFKELEYQIKLRNSSNVKIKYLLIIYLQLQDFLIIYLSILLSIDISLIPATMTIHSILQFSSVTQNSQTARFTPFSIFFIISFAFCLVNTQVQKQIIIDYSNWGGQAARLLAYYHSSENGLYVDLGSYDPIQISNTLNLYVLGWRGINVEANPQRLKRFLYLRPDQVNLAYAVGEDQKFVTLYESSIAPESTISEKLSEYHKKQKNATLLAEIKVPSIPLSKLCKQFYTSKVIFLNMDIEGYEGKALEGNNWKDPNCRPQFIMSQFTEAAAVQAGLPTVEPILKKNNYTKILPNLGNNQLYVANEVLSLYEERLLKGTQYMSNIQMVKFPKIRLSIENHFNISKQFMYNKPNNRHYDPLNSPLLYYFSSKGHPINCEELLLNAQKGSHNKSRDIFIFSFDIQSNYIFGQQCQTKFVSKTKIGEFEYWNYETRIKGKQHFHSVYVFDHLVSGAGMPMIIKMQSCKNEGEEERGEELEKIERLATIIIFLVVIIMSLQIMFCIFTNKQKLKNHVQLASSEVELGQISTQTK